MDKIRITRDENNAVVLRFDKRDDCVSYTVYFRRENGRFRALITTEKTAVKVNAVLGLCYFRITGLTENGRTVNIGTVDTSSLLKKTSFITMGSYNIQMITERSPKFSADNTLRGISPLTAFFPEKVNEKNIDSGKKAFEYIEKNKSDFFIFDFYGTAVHGLIKAENTFLTGGIDGNEKLGEKLPNILPPEVYQPLVDIFAKEILKLYPNDKIILVRTLSPEFYGLSRQVRKSTPKNRLNEFLSKMEAYFIKLVHPVVIDLSGKYFGDLAVKGDGKEAVFDSYYFADCEKALDEIISGEPGKLYKEQDIDSRLDQLMCYYDSACSRGILTVLLDRKEPVDTIMFHTSREFIAENRAELKDMIGQHYSSVTDIYRYYDFGDNIEMKNAVKVIAALESNTLQNVTHGELIRLLDRQYRIKRPIANFVRATLSGALGKEADINEQNLRFMTRLAFELWEGSDPKAIPQKIEEYERIHNFTLIDMWGTGVIKRALAQAKQIKMNTVINGESFVWAFDKPHSIEEKRFSTADRSGAKALSQLMRNSIQTLTVSSARWIAIDMADVIADNAMYNGEGFTVDKQYANSDLAVILGKDGQPFTLDAVKDKERILTACDKLSAFVKQKYGSNIILCRTTLNDKVRDHDGRIKPLVTDKKKFANAKALLEMCEDRFIANTECYVLDNSKNYVSDENFAAGGAGIARFEADFYSAAADYIDYIVQYSPVQRCFEKL